MRDMVESHTIDSLDLDTLYYILKNNPVVWRSLSESAQFTRDIALRCLVEADHSIMRAFPAFLPGMEAEQITNENAINIFKRLINNLHDEAKRLNGDKPFPTTLPTLERMTWECVHYNDLLNEVLIQTEIAKEIEFNKFVEVIAKLIGIAVPQEIDPKKFWHDTLKVDPKILKIQTLNLSDKGIKFLPAEIASLSNLKHLSLAGNQLIDLPPELASLSGLEILDLSNNKLNVIPEALASLSNLQRLQLQDNKIKELSPVFTTLSKLEFLDLSNNPLGKIPKEIAALVSLKHLFINKAGITEMPDNLSALSSLQELCLSNNKLKKIPQQVITSLTSLRKLFLFDNPLTTDTENDLIDIENHSKNLSIQFDNNSVQTRSGHLWNES